MIIQALALYQQSKFGNPSVSATKIIAKRKNTSKEDSQDAKRRRRQGPRLLEDNRINSQCIQAPLVPLE